MNFQISSKLGIIILPLDYFTGLDYLVPYIIFELFAALYHLNLVHHFFSVIMGIELGKTFALSQIISCFLSVF